MTVEEREIIKERIKGLYEDVDKSFSIIDDGIHTTICSIIGEHPNMITRMHLVCDVFMVEQIMEQLTELKDALMETKGEFGGEDDNAN